MEFKSGSKKTGFVITIIAGISNNALIRQEKIETTTNTPKKRRGAKLEKINTEKPTITEKALNTIPRPVVFSVTIIACFISATLAYSSLYRHKKWMV